MGKSVFPNDRMACTWSTLCFSYVKIIPVAFRPINLTRSRDHQVDILRRWVDLRVLLGGYLSTRKVFYLKYRPYRPYWNDLRRRQQFRIAHYVSLLDRFRYGCMSLTSHFLPFAISFPVPSSLGLPFSRAGLLSLLRRLLRWRPSVLCFPWLQLLLCEYSCFFSFASGFLVIAYGWSF